MVSLGLGHIGCKLIRPRLNFNCAISESLNYDIEMLLHITVFKGTNRNFASFVTVPSFKHKLPFNIAFHSCKSTNVHIWFKHAKTAPKPHSWIRPNLANMTPFQGGPRFCEMKIVNKAHIRQAILILKSCASIVTSRRQQHFTKRITVS